MANTAFEHSPTITVPGTGNSTDNAVVLWNGTTGNNFSNSLVIITSGAVTGVTTLTASGAVTGGTLIGTIATTTQNSITTMTGLTTVTASGVVTGGTLAGTVSTATQNSITTMTALTTVGTVGTGTWQGTAIAQTYIAAQAINESKMQVSNGPTDGYFLSAQSGNAGGLTWAEVTGGTTVAGTTDNAILTFVNSGSTFAAEANLTYNGNVLSVGGGIVPTNMTTGIDIDIGAADNNVMSFRSSDVNNPWTANEEASVFGTFKKGGATSGGLQIYGWKDDDGVAGGALKLVGALGEAPDNTHATGSRAVVEIAAQKSNGGTGNADLSSGQNMFAVTSGAGGQTAFIVTADGLLFANAGSTTNAVTVYDEYDDVALVRALDIAKGKHGLLGYIKDEWDDFVKYNEDDLVAAGILGGTLKEGGLLSITGLAHLHNGAIGQLGQRLKAVEAEIVAERNSSIALRNQLAEAGMLPEA